MGNTGANIKNRRKELGLTQSELAKLTGYADKGMISRIESGKTVLTQTRLEALAVALDTTPEHLMGWTPEKAAQSVSFLADQLAQILGYQLGGDPAEGVITLSFCGSEREITMHNWELYEKGLVLYAKHLLNEIYTGDDL